MPVLLLNTTSVVLTIGLPLGAAGLLPTGSTFEATDPERAYSVDTAETVKEFDPSKIIEAARGTENFITVDLDGDGPDDAIVSWPGRVAGMLAYVVRDVDTEASVLVALGGRIAPMGQPYPLNPEIVRVGDTTLLVHWTGFASCLWSYTVVEFYELREHDAVLCGTIGLPSGGGHQSSTLTPRSVKAERLSDRSFAVAATFQLGYGADPLSYTGLRAADFEWRDGPRVDMPRSLERFEWTQRYRWDAEARRLVFDPAISDWAIEPAGLDHEGREVGATPELEGLVDLMLDEIEDVVEANQGHDRLWVLRTAEWLPKGDLREYLSKLVKDVEDPWAKPD